MASGPPSLQSLCVIKLIEGKSNKKLEKIKAPSLIINELKLIKDKIAMQSYKSDYLLNSDLLSYVEKLLEMDLGKVNLDKEREEIKDIAKHINYGKKIHISLVKKYMVSNENYPFIEKFNKSLKRDDYVDSVVFGRIDYIRDPAKYAILKLGFPHLGYHECNRKLFYFHIGCTFCKRQRYKTCEHFYDEEPEFHKYELIVNFIEYGSFLDIEDILTKEEAEDYYENYHDYEMYREYDDYDDFDWVN